MGPKAGELRDQIRWVRKAQEYGRRRIAVWPPTWSDRSWFSYLYRPAELLVTDGAVPQVTDRVPGFQVTGQAVPGVALGTVPDDVDVPALVDRLVAELGPVVSPNHYAYVAPGGLCPADEPEETTRSQPLPRASGAGDGSGVRVAVVDTGLLDKWRNHRWLQGVSGDTDDPDEVPNDGYIDYYAGHGTFCAGVVRAMAPAAEVTVDGVLHLGGAVDEASFAAQVHQALDLNPHIISLSAGFPTAGGRASLVFESLRQRIENQGVLLLAAAGNDGSADEEFYPAAFPWARGVGATTADGSAVADFSNRGPWVDVYAPGEDIVNAYAWGKYLTLATPQQERRFHGIAKWSGTSFATPLVAGLVARRMSARGEGAQAAYDGLVAVAPRLPNGKPVVRP